MKRGMGIGSAKMKAISRKNAASKKDVMRGNANEGRVPVHGAKTAGCK